MKIIELTPELKEDFREFLPAGEDENLGRQSYRFLGAKDGRGKVKGIIGWEYKSDADNEFYASEIKALNTADEKTGKELLSEYDERISEYELDNSFFEFEEVSQLNSKLFKGAGFEMSEEEGTFINATVKELSALKLGKGDMPEHIVSTGDIEDVKLRQGLLSSMFIGIRGLIEDIETIPLSWFERGISSCSLINGRVEGLFLVHKAADGTLMPVLFVNSHPDGKYARQDLLLMLRRSVAAITELYPPETPVKISFLRAQTRELVKKLFPGITGNKVIRGVRKEKEK